MYPAIVRKLRLSFRRRLRSWSINTNNSCKSFTRSLPPLTSPLQSCHDHPGFHTSPAALHAAVAHVSITRPTPSLLATAAPLQGAGHLECNKPLLMWAASKRSKRCVYVCVYVCACVHASSSPLEHQIHPFTVKFPAYRLHIHVHTTIDQIRNPLCSYMALLQWLL